MLALTRCVLISVVALSSCRAQPTDVEPQDPTWLPWPEHARAKVEAALPTPVLGQALVRDRVAVGLDGGVVELDPIDMAIGMVVDSSAGSYEVVQDARIEGSHLQVATLNQQDIRVVDMELQGYLPPVFLGDTPRAASFLGDGRLVALVQWPDRCEVVFVNEQVMHNLPVCEDSLTMRPVESIGVVVALGDKGVWHVTIDGIEKIADRGNMVDWNPAKQHAVLAMAGETELHAVTATGDEVWTRTAGGPLVALSNLGATDELVWAEATQTGSELVWAEGAEGEIARMVHESPIVHIASDDVGTRIGVARLTDYATYALTD